MQRRWPQVASLHVKLGDFLDNCDETEGFDPEMIKAFKIEDVLKEIIRQGRFFMNSEVNEATRLLDQYEVLFRDYDFVTEQERDEEERTHGVELGQRQQDQSGAMCCYPPASDEIWGSAGYPRLTGHSFRIGGTTELLLNGVPTDVVKAMGRWSSDAFLRYWRSLEELAPQYVENLGSRRYAAFRLG